MLNHSAIGQFFGMLILGSLLCANGLQADDWPGFLGARRDGKSLETGIQKDWGAGRLDVLWTVQLGQGYGIGSVVGERFFQLDRVGVETRLRCLEASTGETTWEYRYSADYEDLYGYDAGPRASPLVDEDRVYIYGVAGQLHCVNILNGKRLWSVDLNKDFGVIQNFFGVGSSPIVFGNSLLVMVGGSPPESQKVAPGRLDQVVPNDSLVVVLDKRTGKFQRKFGADLASYSSIQLAKLHGRDVAVVWGRSKLMGFDPANGTTLFEFPFRARSLESVNAATPIIDGNSIFISECYGLGSVLIELDEEFRSRVVWEDRGRRDRSLETHWNTPVLHRGFLYASSGRHTQGSELKCVELATGEVKWSVGGFGRASMTFVDEHLVILDELGQMLLVKAVPEQFERVTSWVPSPSQGIARLKYPCWAAPVISDGRLYIRCKDRIVCFQLIP
ncbi:MAG: PQQ-like beta-propeller repeat protein [Mariniblastus sp.]|nr:PQQ-like beta-propeller repeat protein [Mariniblastus sp.]